MVSLGIGLTSDCNLACRHCYRDRDRVHNLTLEDVEKVCESLAIDSIGFGTGENGLNPDYFDILEYLHSRSIKLTLASNGYTLSLTPDAVLKYFGDVEFSVDFKDQSRQDQFRGAGNWKTVWDGIARCRRLGIRVSVLAVLMNLNYAELGGIAGFAASYGADFRVNVYQPMHTDEFMPSFDQYWQAFESLFAQSEIISVTEPLVHAFLGLEHLQGTVCGGRSLRVTPDRLVKACVYWPDSALNIDDLAEKKETIFQTSEFRKPRTIPEFCRDCRHATTCGGGCAARRMLRGNPTGPDEYCPIFQGKRVQLQGRFSSAARPLRTGSICTTIVRGQAP
jgi:radical SAM protein with 4Fe4S-binding SPASM domain